MKLQDKLAPLHINLFVETSPAPIKYALSLLGKCANTLRLPMVPATEKAQTAVREAMVPRADKLEFTACDEWISFTLIGNAID